MHLKLPVYLLIMLLQIKLYGSNYQFIPDELWVMIIGMMKNGQDLLSTSSFFDQMRTNLNQKKTIVRCKNIAQNNILHNKYESYEFSKKKYTFLTKDGFLIDIFTSSLKKTVFNNYDTFFALSFLKYARKDKFLTTFVQKHTLLKEKINIEYKSHPYRHTIYSLKDTKTKTIKCKTELTEEMFETLFDEYKNDNIVRILLNKNEKFPFMVDENMNKNFCPIIIQTRDGATPLHYYISSPAKEENLKKIEFLVTHTADLEFHNTAGFTPLCFSFLNKNTLKLPDLLLRNGANPNAKSAKMYTNRTPLDFCLFFSAQSDDQKKGELLLLKYGAKENKKRKINKNFALEYYEKNKNFLLLEFEKLLKD